MTKPNLIVDVDRGTLTLGEHRSFVAKAIAVEVLRLQGGASTSDRDCLAIYEAYPLKVGKPKALAAIKAALKTIEAPRLLELTRAFSRARPPGTPFTPHPATWFGQQRFNDDPSTWQPGGAPAGLARVAHDLKAKDFAL